MKHTLYTFTVRLFYLGGNVADRRIVAKDESAAIGKARKHFRYAVRANVTGCEEHNPRPVAVPR